MQANTVTQRIFSSRRAIEDRPYCGILNARSFIIDALQRSHLPCAVQNLLIGVAGAREEKHTILVWLLVPTMLAIQKEIGQLGLPGHGLSTINQRCTLYLLPT
jgi:hypothetical protein